MRFAYLLIMLFTISYPLYKSFEDKVHYVSKWKFVAMATPPIALLFILWDNWFTQLGVWHFNRDFILGFFIGYLPLEEYLFFFFVPFSCVFIHEVLYYFVKNDLLGRFAKRITGSFIILFSTLLFFYYDRLYTMVILSLMIMFLTYHFFAKRTYLGRFYLSFSVCIIPFLLVNGLLTGLPIITYNSDNIMGVFIYTIPLEDLFYGMLYLFLIISLYEFFKLKGEKK